MTTQAPEERREGMEKLQMKIGGMQCSFCVGSINRGFRQMDGVSEVSVSLAHEEALVQYDPRRVTPPQLKDTLVALGYNVRDPDQVRALRSNGPSCGRRGGISWSPACSPWPAWA
jgi:copper chaperone CopZ